MPTTTAALFVALFNKHHLDSSIYKVQMLRYNIVPGTSFVFVYIFLSFNKQQKKEVKVKTDTKAVQSLHRDLKLACCRSTRTLGGGSMKECTPLKPEIGWGSRSGVCCSFGLSVRRFGPGLG